MTELPGGSGKLRVLIVGAGRRVQNNYLPALSCLKDHLVVAGIHSRTYERLAPVAERWSVPAFRTLEEVDFANIDVVAISVQTSQNPIVLQKLAQYAPKLQLVIDTPVVWNRRELAVIPPLLKPYKQVLVTEDYMNFPPFAILRQAVKDGLIGSLRGATLYNIGYLYHGLALIRSFAGFPRAKRTWSRKVGSFSGITGYSFDNGYRAIVVGPYRKHTTGGITIEGSAGILTDFAGDAELGGTGKRPVYTLRGHRDAEGLLSRFSLEGASSDYAVELPNLVAMAALDFPDKSDLNLLRGCGLIMVFQALYETDNINRDYGAVNAIYDSFTPRIASKGVLPVDPLTWLGSDYVKLLSMAPTR